MKIPTDPSVRTQATLFLKGRPEIDEIRLRYNPAQAKLIAAHVTLCREDEVDDWTQLQKKIGTLAPLQLELGFGAPVRHEHFVFLPVVAGIQEFDRLRNVLLSTELFQPRIQVPHVTIIHPRNGICTDEVYCEIAEQLSPFTTSFQRISLIQQSAGGPWAAFG